VAFVRTERGRQIAGRGGWRGWTVGIALALIVAGLWSGYRLWRQFVTGMQCPIQLRRQVHPQIFDWSSGALTLRQEVGPLPACPGCGDPYVFRRVPSPLRAIDEKPFSDWRPVIWCPAPCHWGKRYVTFENTLVFECDEETFQAIMLENRIGDRFGRLSER
jgi:hypothetical protein